MKKKPEKRKPEKKKPPVKESAPAKLPAIFQQAALGFLIKRAGWHGKSVTGDGRGGFVMQDGSPYKPAAGDLEATDWRTA